MEEKSWTQVGFELTTLCTLGLSSTSWATGAQLVDRSCMGSLVGLSYSRWGRECHHKAINPTTSHFKLTPPEEAEFDPGEMRIGISLEVGVLPVSSTTHIEGCELHAQNHRIWSFCYSSPASEQKQWRIKIYIVSVLDPPQYCCS